MGRKPTSGSWPNLDGLVGRARLGTGVLGKTAPVAIAFFGLLGIVAYKLANMWALLTVVGAGAAIALTYLFLSFRFANRNPAAALLEGGDFVQHAQLRLGTKDEELRVITPIPNPALEGPKGSVDA